MASNLHQQSRLLPAMMNLVVEEVNDEHPERTGNVAIHNWCCDPLHVDPGRSTGSPSLDQPSDRASPYSRRLSADSTQRS
jgi:hypothetical protein